MPHKKGTDRTQKTRDRGSRASLTMSPYHPPKRSHRFPTVAHIRFDQAIFDQASPLLGRMSFDSLGQCLSPMVKKAYTQSRLSSPLKRDAKALFARMTQYRPVPVLDKTNRVAAFTCVRAMATLVPRRSRQPPCWRRPNFGRKAYGLTPKASGHKSCRLSVCDPMPPTSLKRKRRLIVCGDVHPNGRRSKQTLSKFAHA